MFVPVIIEQLENVTMFGLTLPDGIGMPLPGSIEQRCLV